MIYYFSGTGNSEWIAKFLAKKTNDEAIDLVKYKAKRIEISEDTEKVGLVYPVYAFNTPLIVRKFAERLIIPKGPFVYAVANCASASGRALTSLKKIYPYKSAYCVAMPNNYILGSGVDSLKVADKKVFKADVELHQIAKDINEHKEVFDDKYTNLAQKIVSPLSEYLMDFFYNGAKNFKANRECIGCGICADNCPMDVIKMVNERPVWNPNANCILCLKCISHCPVNAIDYGDKTVGKARYKLPEKYEK